ncbi:hypothetical protein BRADI_3g10286v3 [Brachypodium distachyon]|uniref:Uncharacterized protein n=1 Tax=Brachypodium distachyon TaxID=15368 RepID=A0A0Q3LPF3_BRADI|nr:hypothetical protein BRADI_3g10286v3 [Brachypodium distachyon]
MPSPTRRVPGLRRAPLRLPLHALLVARLLSHGSRAPSRAAPALPARTPRRPPPLPRDPLAGSPLRPELHALGADCLPPLVGVHRTCPTALTSKIFCFPKPSAAAAS